MKFPYCVSLFLDIPFCSVSFPKGTIPLYLISHCSGINLYLVKQVPSPCSTSSSGVSWLFLVLSSSKCVLESTFQLKNLSSVTILILDKYYYKEITLFCKIWILITQHLFISYKFYSYCILDDVSIYLLMKQRNSGTKLIWPSLYYISFICLFLSDWLIWSFSRSFMCLYQLGFCISQGSMQERKTTSGIYKQEEFNTENEFL